MIAVDQDGRPALVANIVGSGKTLLSAYPIETYLANTPAVFEKAESTHRIYEAFRNWTGREGGFSKRPAVGGSDFAARRPSRICGGGESQCAGLQGDDLDVVAGEIGSPDWGREFQSAARRRRYLEDGHGTLRSGHRGVEVRKVFNIFS